MSIHIPTTIFAIILVSIVMGLAVLFVAWGHAQEGLRTWADALFLHATGYVLFALRGAIPDFVSIVAAYVAVSGALSMMLLAIHQFQRRPAAWWKIAGPPLVAAIGFAILLHWLAARIVFGSILVAAQIGLMIAALRSQAHPIAGRGRLLLLLATVPMAAIFLVRAAAHATGIVVTPTFASSNVIQAISFSSSLVAILISSLGFIFMTKERADEHNRVLAVSDDLTGLANRRAILITLARQLSQARRAGSPLCVLMIDIDFFKQVNDASGHLAGDQALRRVAEVCRARLRGQDAIGRYGGDEFLAVLPDTSRDGGLRIAEVLREVVSGTAIAREAQSMCVTVSIGVHSVIPEPSETPEDLIRKADESMFEAKRRGRNRVHSSPP